MAIRAGHAFLGVALLCCAYRTSAEPITRLWLTHTQATPITLTVNWETPEAGPSRVDFGPSDALDHTVDIPDAVTLHQVEIPFPDHGALHYRVSTGTRQSAIHTVQSYGEETLRVAVAANWQTTPPLDALQRDRPHLLISCGDLTHGLMRFDRPGDTTYTAPFSHFIDAYPTLFAQVPFLPLPGNHDRQLLPRLPKPPPVPAYDLDATAFRRFFPLPPPGRHWRFDILPFDLRLIALDLSHTADAGTTRQSCPPFGPDSEQFRWFQETMANSHQGFVLTLYNEWHHLMNTLADGIWMPRIQQGTAAISGFGFFAERAEYDGLPCFNTALQTGPLYANGHHTKFHQVVQSYILLTFRRDGGPMRVALKDLQGNPLDVTEWSARTR